MYVLVWYKTADILEAASRKAKILRNAGIADISGLSIILTGSKTTREFVEEIDNFWSSPAYEVILIENCEEMIFLNDFF